MANNVMAYAEEIKPDFSESTEESARGETGIFDTEEEIEEPAGEDEAEAEEGAEGEDADEEEPAGEDEAGAEEDADKEDGDEYIDEAASEEEADADETERELTDWTADPMFSFTYICLEPTEDAGIYELDMDLEFRALDGEEPKLAEGDWAVLELPEEWFEIEDTAEGDSLPVFYEEKGDEEEILSSEPMAEYTVAGQRVEVVFGEHAEEIGDVSGIAGKLALKVRIPRRAMDVTERSVSWEIQTYSDGTVNQADVVLPARKSKDWTEETGDFWAEITEAEEEDSAPQLEFGFLKENPEYPVMSGDTAEVSLEDSGYTAEISKDGTEVRGWIADGRNRMTETDRVIAVYTYSEEEQKICLTFTEGIEELEDIASYRGVIALKQPEEVLEEQLLMVQTELLQMFDAGDDGQRTWDKAVTQDIYWQDNNDTGIRPDNDEYKTHFLEAGKLQYSYVVNGETYTVLVEAKDVLTEEKITVSDEGGTGHYIMKVDSGVLPGTASVAVDGEQKDVEITGWSFVHPDVDNYYFLDVPDEETMSRYTTSEVELGWYYLKEFNYTLTVTLRCGDTHPIHGMTEAILEDFAFHYRRNGADSDFQSVTLADMLKQSPDAVTIEVPQAGAGENEINELVLSINGIPQYRIDGTERQYFLQQTEGHEQLIPQQEEGEDGLDDGGYFQITYDNTNSPNYGTVTDKGYSGGNLILTLTGDQEYSATKNWMDNDRTDDRPAVEFTLWRYSKRDGADSRRRPR